LELGYGFIFAAFCPVFLPIICLNALADPETKEQDIGIADLISYKYQVEDTSKKRAIARV